METLFRTPFMNGLHTHTHTHGYGLAKSKRNFARNFALNPFSIKNGK